MLLISCSYKNFGDFKVKKNLYEMRIFMLDLSDIIFELIDNNLVNFKKKLAELIPKLIDCLERNEEACIKNNVAELFYIISEFSGFLSKESFKRFAELKKESARLAKYALSDERIRRMLISFFFGLLEET